MMTDVPRPAPPISEQLIAALVPETTSPDPAPAPLPALPTPTRLDRRDLGPILIATCVPDRSGRVNAAPLLAALAWRPGERIEVDVVHGIVVVTATRTGRHVIGSRGDIGIASAVRTMCGIQPDQSVLMAALVSRGVLAIHPAHTVTRLLARLHGQILGDHHDR
jgi:hypothetical protein